MMRANLLPRPRENVRILGLGLDRDAARDVVLGIVILILVTVLGLAIESFRLERIEAAQARADAALAASASDRREAKDLAQDVARYQQIAREALFYRDSGAEAALAIVRLGNGLPSRVWLDGLERENNAYRVSGDTADIGLVGETIVALGRSDPAATAKLLSVEDRHRAGVHFQATVRRAGELATSSGVPLADSPLRGGAPGAVHVGGPFAHQAPVPIR